MTIDKKYTRQDCMVLWRTFIRKAGSMRDDLTPTFWHTMYINMQPFRKIMKIMQEMDTHEYYSLEYKRAAKELEEMRNIFSPMN